MPKTVSEAETPQPTNWSKAFDYMNDIQDPVVRSLMSLVYVHFVHDGLEGTRPNDFDLLYCFQLLDKSFSFKEGFQNALAGQYDE